MTQEIRSAILLSAAFGVPGVGLSDCNNWSVGGFGWLVGCSSSKPMFAPPALAAIYTFACLRTLERLVGNTHDTLVAWNHLHSCMICSLFSEHRYAFSSHVKKSQWTAQNNAKYRRSSREITDVGCEIMKL
jgi:hypothetical protein